MKINKDVNVGMLIGKLKHGIEILSQFSKVSASRLPISVATVLGVTGLFLAIKDGKLGKFSTLLSTSDGDDSLEELWLVPGLQNLGNNCFLNVILQALASCSNFQEFLEKIWEEFEFSSVEERANSWPLTTVLASLTQDLGCVQKGKAVLSPEKVILAMHNYIPNFNLTSQQDAEEAFFHMLSSLREELSESYVPKVIPLADVSACHGHRILTPQMTMEESEQRRWRCSFHGPFDGILGSILTCRSCSFQISLDFQFFHSLHLSPVLSSSVSIMAGCSLEDCLKKFLVEEQLENYWCTHCWHFAAIRYLSSTGESETDIRKLQLCDKQGSCNCKKNSFLQALPWTNSFSRIFKKLSIASSPKILCIHLQRVSMNAFGELVKLQGHISFPLFLNLSPFMKHGVGVDNCQEIFTNGQPDQQPIPYYNSLKIQLDQRMQKYIFGQSGKSFSSEQVVAQELAQTLSEFKQASRGECSVPETRGCWQDTFYRISMQSSDKVGRTCYSEHPPMYRLVSVVQHLGRAGSGHYIIFRRVKIESTTQDRPSDSAHVQWFCISDSEVHPVSEEEVLAADASLLFYEKVLPSCK